MTETIINKIKRPFIYNFIIVVSILSSLIFSSCGDALDTALNDEPPDTKSPTITSWTASTVIYDTETVEVTFSEDILNANVAGNYQLNFDGIGTVTIFSIVYDNHTSTATLTISTSGTDGSEFTIQTVTGGTPITDGENILLNGISNIYFTKDTISAAVTVNQAAAQPDPTNNPVINFNVSFSEPVNPATFKPADIKQNGTATGITWNISNSGDDQNFILSTTSITGDGTVIPSISAGRVLDKGSVPNLASTSTDNSVTFDGSPPSVTVEQAGPDPTNTLAISFDVVFSEAVNPATFTIADITQNGTAAVTTWSIVNSGDNRNFTLSATAVAGNGTVIPSITAGLVQDNSGNNNTASTSVDNSVMYEDRKSVV